MGLTLLFLGKLADHAGRAEQVLEIDGPCDWAGLLGHLPTHLATELDGEKIQLAVNGVLLPDKRRLNATTGDELAFLPPVSGG